MTEVFIKNFCFKNNIPIKQLNKHALDLLGEYQWPGNVRELKNVIIKLITQSEDQVITSNNVQMVLGKDNHSASASVSTASLREATDSFQRNLILDRLRQYDGNVTETARDLGENRSHFYRRLKKLGIS